MLPAPWQFLYSRSETIQLSETRYNAEMLNRPILLIAFAVSAIQAQPMFEGATGLGADELHGKPKLVRVEREKVEPEKPGNKPVFLPEEEAIYRDDGQLSSHKRYSEGKLVLNEFFDYDSEGHRSVVTERDPDGKITRTRTYHRQPDQSEEELVSAGGKNLSRTIRRFDAQQRVTELENTDTPNVATIMHFSYDDLGRPIEARVIENAPDRLHKPVPESQQLTMRVQILYPREKRAIITVYGPDGKIMVQLESTEDAAGNQMGQILFEHEPQGKSATSERIDAKDPQGNWTLKTLIERDSATQLDQVVARLHRSVSYY
jgi:hypothetical protein